MNLKEQEGMGHLATFFCIIIIIAIITICIYYIKNMMQQENKKNYETDMLLIQGKIKVISQESTIQKKEEILQGKKLSENLENEEIKKLLQNKIISEEESDFTKYYILEKTDLEELGLSSIELTEGYYIVNYETYEVIYTSGVKIDNNYYYKLSELQTQTGE